MKTRFTTNRKGIVVLLVSLLYSSHLTFGATDNPPTPTFKIAPASIPAGRSRSVKISAEPAIDLTGFSVLDPSDDTGVLVEDGNGTLGDNNKSLVVRITVEDDADEQTFPLIIAKTTNGVTKKYTVDLTVTAFKPKAIPSQATPPGVGKSDAVDSMMQPMSYKATKDVFGRRVADSYYAVVIGLGNNTGFDLQVNKIAFNSAIVVDVPDVNPDNNSLPLMTQDGTQVSTHKEFLQITAVDRTLVRPTVEKEQSFGKRALAMNLIGGVGALTTGFLPFFHALGPRANFSSISSIINGQFREGFNIAVPDLTIRQLNRLDNSIVMDDEFMLPNNSERNTVVFVPRAVLNLPKKERDDLQKVKALLGNLIIVGRPLSRYANRQIVVRTGGSTTSFAKSSDGAGGTSSETPKTVATSAPTLTAVAPAAGLITQPTEVRITGSNFVAGTSVKFDNQPAEIKSLSSNEIVALVPIHNSGTVPVVVANRNGLQSQSKSYTYYSEFIVGGTDRPSGSTAGGEKVRIIGSGFIRGVKVSVGGAELPSDAVTFVDANNILITMPAHEPGNVTITVVNPSPYPNQSPKAVPGGYTYVTPGQ